MLGGNESEDDFVTKIEISLEPYGSSVIEMAIDTFFTVTEDGIDPDLVCELVIEHKGNISKVKNVLGTDSDFSQEWLNSIGENAKTSQEEMSKVSNKDILCEIENNPNLCSKQLYDTSLDTINHSEIYFSEPVQIHHVQTGWYIGLPQDTLCCVPQCSVENDLFFFVSVNEPDSTKPVKFNEPVRIVSAKTNSQIFYHFDYNCFILGNHSSHTNVTNQFKIVNSKYEQQAKVTRDAVIIIMAIGGGTMSVQYLNQQPNIMAVSGVRMNDQSLFKISKPLGKAIPLLLPNNMQAGPNGQYFTDQSETRKSLVLQQQALDIIKKIKGPVSVVVICGKARTGKSYILSKMIDLNAPPDCFHLGHEMSAKTMGIWMWSQPLKILDKRGQELNLILLDTEGVDAANSNYSNDNYILVLSVLFSSVFIYNSTSHPSATSLGDLVFATQISTNIVHKTSPKNKTMLQSVSPRFLWLFRDVTLHIPSDYSSMTDFVLRGICGDEATTNDTKLKEIRKSIFETFEDFKALTFRHPGTTYLDTICYNEKFLELKFLAQVRDLVLNVIPETIKPKQNLDGVAIDGYQYATLMALYLRAINTNGLFPDIEDSFSMAMENSFIRVRDDCLKEYEVLLGQQISPSEVLETEELFLIHDSTWQEVVERFNKHTMFERNEQTLTLQSDILLRNVRKVLAKFENDNSEKSLKLCMKLKKEFLDHLSVVVQRLTPQDTIENLQKQVEKQFLEYDCNAKGPRKEEVKVEILKDIERMTKEYHEQIKKMKDYEENVAQLKVQNEKEQAEKRQKESELKALALQNQQQTKDFLTKQQEMMKAMEESKQKSKQEREQMLQDWNRKEAAWKQEHTKHIENMKRDKEVKDQEHRKRVEEMQKSINNLQHQINNMPRPSSGGSRGFCTIQ